jgi:hypothetical protein
MSRSYASYLDPQSCDAKRTWEDDDASGELLEDRLYLPCGIDPHGDICGVCFVHPYPQCKEVLCQKIIRNNDLKDMLWLIAMSDKVFESTSMF